MKKLLKISFILMILSIFFISCGNSVTEPKSFYVRDLIGRWQTKNDASDYFLITVDGYIQLSNGNKVRIENWAPYEYGNSYKLTAQTTNNHFITFLFESTSKCEVSVTTGEKEYYYKL